MTRDEFMATLERGLQRMPADKHAEILADYGSYFTEGIAAGRREEEVADSLGNPARLAAELSLGHEIAAHAGSPRAVVRPLLALLAYVMLQGVLWLPLVLGVLLVLVLLGTGVVAVAHAALTLVIEPFDLPLGGLGAVTLRAFGYLAGGVAALGVARAGVLLLVKFFVRIHRRPAWRPTTGTSQ
jgi:uncharacterized membrane protein